MKEEEIQTLIRYRLEQAQTALDDAKFLLDGGRSPQSIVNRSYYAMFYAALALLQRAVKIPSKHTGVIGLFDTEFVLKGAFPKELSQDFHKAFELRQKSDYRITKPVAPEQAKAIWEKAQQFVAQVNNHLASTGHS